MTRIDRSDSDEYVESGEGNPEEPREEGRGRKRLSLRGWAVVIAIVVLVPALWMTSVLMRLGVMTIPVISGWVYDPVVPEREVIPLAGYRISGVLGTFGARSTYDFTTGFVDTFIREQELTTLISQALSETEDAPFEVTGAQIVVEEGFVELYVTMHANDGVVPLRARVILSTDGRILEWGILEVIIGGYVIPKPLANIIFSVFGKNILTSVREGLLSLGELRAVSLQQGRIEITFDPSVKVQK